MVIQINGRDWPAQLRFLQELDMFAIQMGPFAITAQPSNSDSVLSMPRRQNARR